MPILVIFRIQDGHSTQNANVYGAPQKVAPNGVIATSESTTTFYLSPGVVSEDRRYNMQSEGRRFSYTELCHQTPNGTEFLGDGGDDDDGYGYDNGHLPCDTYFPVGGFLAFCDSKNMDNIILSELRSVELEVDPDSDDRDTGSEIDFNGSGSDFGFNGSGSDGGW